jgi:ribosome modulation factor
VHAWSCTLQVWAGRGELYIPTQLISSNSGWHDGWFYLRNDDDRLPKFSGRILMSREDNWSYGVIEEEKLKLQPLLDMLRRLRQRGLTTGMVAATFHYRRVLPLMQRRLRIDEMMPSVSLEGSQMSHETLPLDEVAQRARWMVGSFKQEDIDKVLIRPNQGFQPLVRVVPLALSPFASWFS